MYHECLREFLTPKNSEMHGSAKTKISDSNNFNNWGG